MVAPYEYKPLSGVGNTALDGRLAFRHRAYLGPDHILLVRRSRYSESYRRLYLDDVQGVFYNETDDARLFNVGALSGAISAAALSIAFSLSSLAAAPVGVFLSAAAGLFLFIFLMISLAQGASVRCWIRTARGVTLVPNVGRLRPARRFATAVEDAIGLRQGKLDSEQAAGYFASLQAPLFGDAKPRLPVARRFAVAWILLLSEAFYAAMTMALPSIFPPGLLILFAVVACGGVLMGLFSGARHQWRFAYRALFTAAAYYTTSKVIYWGLFWFLLTTEQIVAFEIAPDELFLFGAFTITVNGLMGVAGLVMRPDLALPPSPPPPASVEDGS